MSIREAWSFSRASLHIYAERATRQTELPRLPACLPPCLPACLPTTLPPCRWLHAVTIYEYVPTFIRFQPPKRPSRFVRVLPTFIRPNELHFRYFPLSASTDCTFISAFFWHGSNKPSSICSSSYISRKRSMKHS